jgi:hypothetical protein
MKYSFEIYSKPLPLCSISPITLLLKMLFYVILFMKESLSVLLIHPLGYLSKALLKDSAPIPDMLDFLLCFESLSEIYSCSEVRGIAL